MVMIVLVVRAVMVMFVLVLVMVVMVVILVCVVMMRVGVAMTMALIMLFVHDMNIELHARDARFLAARNVQVVTVKREFGQFAFQAPSIETQINQRSKEHVAADAAENVEVEGFHPIGYRPQGH